MELPPHFLSLSLRNTGMTSTEPTVHQRPYGCNMPGCGKRFATGGNLKKHQRAVHIWEHPHPYACTEPGCGKRFATGGGLIRHQRAVHGVR